MVYARVHFVLGFGVETPVKSRYNRIRPKHEPGMLLSLKGVHVKDSRLGRASMLE